VGKSVVLTAIVKAGTAATKQVEFFDGGDRVGLPLAASPYQYTYTPQTTGKHALVAKVTDAAGNAVVSDVQYLTVTAVGAAQPIVTLNPVTPTSAQLGTSFTLVANASVSGGTIAKVEFFDGATLIGTDTSTPYAVSYAPGTTGQHVFSAKATDLNGNSAISATQTVTITAVPSQPNQLPTVSLTLNPASLTLGQSTTLTSVASDPDGTVAKVEFLDGTTSLAVLTAPPYSYVYTPTGSAGNRSLRAVATDDKGATATASQTLAVGSPTLPTPPAPTLAYNQSARTTTATPPNGYTISDLRYTLNGSAVTPVPSTGDIPMGSGATPIGGLQVYVVKNSARNEGDHAANTVGFDAVSTPPIFGKTLTGPKDSESTGTKLAASTGDLFKFNLLPLGATDPRRMNLLLNGTQVAAVDFLAPYNATKNQFSFQLGGTGTIYYGYFADGDVALSPSYS
jgi:hypothetical protein